jgi:hypothetical protein
LSLFLIFLLFIFYEQYFKSKPIAIFASVVFLFNGGFGFVVFIKDLLASTDWKNTILFPPRTYTNIEPMFIKWTSIVDTMLVPQRAFQLGFPLGILILVLIKHYLLVGNNLSKLPLFRSLAAGVLLGLMPLIHIHSFLCVTFISGMWFLGEVLVFRKEWNRERFTAWGLFFFCAALLAVPASWYFQLFQGGHANAMRWFPGWYAKEGGIPFWKFSLWNYGIHPFVAVAGAVYCFKNLSTFKEKKILIFSIAPFFILLVLVHLIAFHPWIWDNTKFMVWGYLLSSGFSGYFIFRCFCARRAKLAYILLGTGLFFTLILSGALDAFRLLKTRLNTYQMYTSEELALSDWVIEHSPPNSLWLTAPYHNNFLFNLTGRKVVMGYEGWLWTHGYDYKKIERDVRKMLSDPERSFKILNHYKIDFLLIGPIEQDQYKANPDKLSKLLTLIKKTDNYFIYSTGRSPLIKKEETMPILSGELILPDLKLEQGANLYKGLIGNVYSNTNFYGASRPFIHSSEIGFRYDSGMERFFKSGESIEWNGYLRMDQDEEKIFSLESDDGSWFYLNDRLILSNGGIHEKIKVTNTVRMKQGFYKLKLKYFDSTGGAALNFKWSTPHSPEEFVRPELFFHEKGWKKKRRKLMIFD